MADNMKIANRRVKAPTLLQMEAVECGAAALGIILGYFGKHRPLEELRTECGVSRDGSKAKNILYGARRYGLTAKGRKVGVESALNTAFPFIAFWNFNHFLVVEGYRNGVVYLNDPATGPRSVLLNDFDTAFTGVILVFEKGDKFAPEAKPPGVLSRLLPRTKPIRTAMLLSVLISLTLVIPGLVIPGFSKVFVDEVLIQGKDDWLKPLLVFMFLSMLVNAALIWLSQSVLLRSESKLALSASAKFVWHLFRLPIDFFSQRHAGDISNRINANDRIAGTIAGDLGESIVSLIRVLFYGAVMLFFDWKLAIAAMALSLINVFVFRFLMRQRADASLRVQQDFGQFQSSSVTGIQAIETLKATGTDDDYFERWAGFQAKNLNNQKRLGMLGIIANAFPPLIDGLMIAIVLGLGGYQIMQGEMTIGTLVAFQALIQNFSGPINALVATGGALQELGADLIRTDDVMRQPQDIRYTERQIPDNDRLSGRIELRDVTFGYSRLEPPLIENFNLMIEPGARVALVGGSGSGKSTIAKLMTGLYRPWSGEILFDGRPLDEIPVSTLTQSIAAVSQEIILFGGSVRDNLGAWDEQLPDQDMIHALNDANIMEVVAGRGGSLDAKVDEGGSNFSGGQAQRLEIARALAGGPSILVLDEATSALDTTTEAEIDSAIRRRGCSCVIVAHRLSTIRDADEIVVLNFGEVVERGTHEELTGSDGPYAQLIAHG
jgi:NHLM bacteriocin system ABC transporter peptidase/ATP-binding protein